jgi:N-methylhydantoinase A
MMDFAVHDREALRPGMHFNGPAVVEEASATTVIDDGGQVEVDRYGSLVISLEVEVRS